MSNINVGEKQPQIMVINELVACPIPTFGLITVPLPEDQSIVNSLVSFSGKQILQVKIETPGSHFSFDLRVHPQGVYLIRLVDDSGRTFRVKVVKDYMVETIANTDLSGNY